MHTTLRSSVSGRTNLSTNQLWHCKNQNAVCKLFYQCKYTVLFIINHHPQLLCSPTVKHKYSQLPLEWHHCFSNHWKPFVYIAVALLIELIWFSPYLIKNIMMQVWKFCILILNCLCVASCCSCLKGQKFRLIGKVQCEATPSLLLHNNASS